MFRGNHTASGRQGIGLLLGAVTVLLWGVLPLFLKALLERMDALTISWYRLLAAGILLYLYLAFRDGPGFPRRVLRSPWWLLAAAGGGLAGNYFTYVYSMNFITPAAAAVIIQLGPFLMLLGGLVLFRERFSRAQKFGAVVLLGGLALFFNRSLPLLLRAGPLSTGVLIILVSSVAWAAYAMAQKQLLAKLPSEEIMWFVYCFGAAALAPFASPGSVLALDGIGWALLAFCALNTLVAYGCFAEALEHMEASRLSLIISLSPLVTIAAEALGARLFPGAIERSGIGWAGAAGAGLVVAGSILAALGRGTGRRVPRV